MNKKTVKYTFLLFVSVTWGCSTTKNIPEGKYLLNSFEIKSDKKAIDVTYLEDYIQQQPNSTLAKMRLRVYNLAGQDTSKWINRTIQKLGQPPVIYSPRLTEVSATQLAKELSNLGYLRATVDTVLIPKGKKMNVRYDINSGNAYRIRNYEYTIYNKNINRSLKPARKYTRVQPGTVFSQVVLDNSL